MATKETADKPLSPRDLEIARLRKIDRQKRSEQQIARLAELLAQDRRDRFTRLEPNRIKALRKAVANVIRLSNPQSYQYEDSERDGIIQLGQQIAAQLKQAFSGAPTERGKYDL